MLVGKKAKDNDYLTFRMAKSLDTWMHAADYPGSHVVVRNPNRREIPQKTLLEAAQLAAFYSQARRHPKAAVHYTQKKFVNKPRGAAPGLVSLASFKTILVEPKVPDF
ncbi:MAG: NFACT RNA binding domain-containing protein [Acidobacteria bacterium]|nr:NFACT RNA binding domain-containing protein [Acidobacteriota bacterium]